MLFSGERRVDRINARWACKTVRVGMFPMCWHSSSDTSFWARRIQPLKISMTLLSRSMSMCVYVCVCCCWSWELKLMREIEPYFLDWEYLIWLSCCPHRCMHREWLQAETYSEQNAQTWSESKMHISQHRLRTLKSQPLASWNHLVCFEVRYEGGPWV